MRTQIAKTWYLPAEYIPLAFLTRTPSPYSAGWRWGLLSRKIFLIFIFQILARIHRMSGLRIFFYFLVSPIRFLLVFYFFYFSDFRLVYPILGFQLNSFTEYLRFNLFIFARYYLDYDSDFASDLRLVFTRIKLCRFYALFLQLFISLTLLLIINKHLCLFKFVLCLFWLF